MSINPQQFYRATNPAKTLDMGDSKDKNYYVDFSSVRGGEIITELKDRITWSGDNQFTCNLFTGHIGCGKSTELLRLKAELEAENYYVIYFEADEDLDMGNIEVSDILLAIARRTAKELETFKTPQEKGTNTLIQNAKKLLLTEIKLSGSGEIPGIGKFNLGVDFDNNVEIGLSTIIGEIKAETRKNTDLRDKLRNYLEPKTDGLLDVLNRGLFEPAIPVLQAQGKTGLVIIMDNLDKMINVTKSNGKLQSNYLFVDRGSDLNRLACHLIYTMPLALRYSDDYPLIEHRFKTIPVVLPMIRVKNRQGEEDQEGLRLLKELVLKRAFPDLNNEERFSKITELFEDENTLNQLCRISGGHVRNLLILLNSWIIKEKKFPLTLAGLNTAVINQMANQISHITEDEWQLLRRVHQEKQLGGDDDYEKLIRNLLVYEYRDQTGVWYEVNPIFIKTEQFQKKVTD